MTRHSVSDVASRRGLDTTAARELEGAVRSVSTRSGKSGVYDAGEYDADEVKAQIWKEVDDLLNEGVFSIARVRQGLRLRRSRRPCNQDLLLQKEIYEAMKATPPRASRWSRARTVFTIGFRSMASLHTVTVDRPPGSRIAFVGEFFFSAKTYQSVIKPAYRDLLDEYTDALGKGRHWKARWVRLSHSWGLIEVMAMQAPIALAKRIWHLWKMQGGG